MLWNTAPVPAVERITLAESLSRSLNCLPLPPVLSLAVWNLEESQVCRQSLQPLTNFCLQAGGAHTHACCHVHRTDTHVPTHTLARLSCHHQLVSVLHLWMVTRRRGSQRSHSCLTDSRDQFPPAERASSTEEGFHREALSERQEDTKRKKIYQIRFSIILRNDISVHVDEQQPSVLTTV